MADEINNIYESLPVESDVEDDKNTETMEDEDVKKKAEEKENVQCRYCHQEDLITLLESPCFCNGTLKYVHRGCVRRWCNAKGNIICEICHQPFQPNYTVVKKKKAINPRARLRLRTPRPEREFAIYLNEESRSRSMLYGAGIILCVALYFLLLAREKEV